jgi:hypothetical protein
MRRIYTLTGLTSSKSHIFWNLLINQKEDSLLELSHLKNFIVNRSRSRFNQEEVLSMRSQSFSIMGLLFPIPTVGLQRNFKPSLNLSPIMDNQANQAKITQLPTQTATLLQNKTQKLVRPTSLLICPLQTKNT